MRIVKCVFSDGSEISFGKENNRTPSTREYRSLYSFERKILENIDIDTVEEYASDNRDESDNSCDLSDFSDTEISDELVERNMSIFRLRDNISINEVDLFSRFEKIIKNKSHIEIDLLLKTVES